MLNWTLFVVFGMFVFNHADGQYPGARLILTSKVLDYGNIKYPCVNMYIATVCSQMCRLCVYIRTYM